MAYDPETKQVKLEDCRMCVYWDKKVKGFNNLSNEGPGEGCRITKPAISHVDTYHAIMEMTPKAIKRWRLSPWK